MEPKALKKKLLKCRKCSKRFETQGGLNLHSKQHQPHLFLISCPDCPFSTCQKGNFAKHAAVRHGKDSSGAPISKSLQCLLCTFKSFTEAQLKAHLVRTHSSAHPFTCTVCSYSSVEKAALQKHIRIVHKQERSFQCTLCHFRSQTSSGLSRHRRSHLETKPHECHLCPSRFADKKRLRDHLLTHANIKPFSCPNCKYATNRNDNLKTHIKRNHT